MTATTPAAEPAAEPPESAAVQTAEQGHIEDDGNKALEPKWHPDPRPSEDLTSDPDDDECSNLSCGDREADHGHNGCRECGCSFTVTPTKPTMVAEEALSWLIRVHDSDPSHERLLVVQAELERLRAEAGPLTPVEDYAATVVCPHDPPCRRLNNGWTACAEHVSNDGLEQRSSSSNPPPESAR